MIEGIEPNTLISMLNGTSVPSASTAGISAVRTATDAGTPADNSAELLKLREACRDFEAIFIHQLLKIMRESGPKSDFIDTGFANEIYRDMMDERLAYEIADGGSFGIGEMLYEELRASLISSIQATAGTETK